MTLGSRNVSGRPTEVSEGAKCPGTFEMLDDDGVPSRKVDRRVKALRPAICV
jgi:hypothetical protein